MCMPIIMIVTAFAALVSSGGAPRASIYMGKQDNKSAEQILGNCFSLQIVVSIVLTVVLLIWNKDLLMAFGASKNTLGYATDYMRIYALGTLFRSVNSWYERLYYCSGIHNYFYGFRSDRCHL